MAENGNVGWNRYDGCMEHSEFSMPEPLVHAHTSSMVVGEVIGRFEAYSKDPDACRSNYPWASRFVMGYPLPSWQRDLVWTPEQCKRFIVSLWAGVDVGSYLVNESYEFLSDRTLREFSDVLLDGQQRLHAIEMYLQDSISIPDAQGVPRFWSEVSRAERRRFTNVTFACATVKSFDEQLLRKVYDLRAFGGTPHKECERALPSISVQGDEP